MKSPEFLTYMIDKAVALTKETTKADSVDVGHCLNVITIDGKLRYVAMSEEAMEDIFNKVSPGIEHSSMLGAIVLPANPEKDVYIVSGQEGMSDVEEGSTLIGLDIVEILVDEENHSNFLLMSEGDEVINIGGFVYENYDDSCIFKYKESSLTLNY